MTEFIEGDLAENIKISVEPIDRYDQVIVPKIVFIVPYRNREQQQHFFAHHMKYIMQNFDEKEYHIYYAHQCDTRQFNRGAMKNIGFLAIKEKYPDNYKDITFVFNDVDTMPYTPNFIDYDTVHGEIRHPYGFTHTLGGIVSIKGSDYEQTNGFPNLWAWGYEDNMFQVRSLNCGLKINRNNFVKFGDKNIMHMNDGFTRNVNRDEFIRYKKGTNDGISSITDVVYTIDEMSGFINITGFTSLVPSNSTKTSVHKLENGARPFHGRYAAKMPMRL